MGYDHSVSNQVISVSLNGDLLRQVQLRTQDLDGTLERLLADFVARQQPRDEEREAAIDRTIAAFDKFHAEHGYLSDEFSEL